MDSGYVYSLEMSFKNSSNVKTFSIMYKMLTDLTTATTDKQRFVFPECTEFIEFTKPEQLASYYRKITCFSLITHTTFLQVLSSVLTSLDTKVKVCCCVHGCPQVHPLFLSCPLFHSSTASLLLPFFVLVLLSILSPPTICLECELSSFDSVCLFSSFYPLA